MNELKHPLFDEAVQFLKGQSTISCNELQLHFKIGYNSGGRLIDQLEDAKVVGPFEGSKARKVLI